MNEDKDFSLGGEKNGYNGASLTGRARQLNAKKQNAEPALAVAERGYLLQHGEIVASGPIAELMDELYPGAGRGARVAPRVSYGDLEGYGPLRAVAGRKSTPSHGADGADALQGIGQQWPSDRSNDVRWRLGGSESGVRSLGFGVLSSVFCLLYSRGSFPSQPGLMRWTPLERRRSPDFDFPIFSPQKSQTELK
jgi:hypothetical protein